MDAVALAYPCCLAFDPEERPLLLTAEVDGDGKRHKCLLFFTHKEAARSYLEQLYEERIPK